MTAQFVDSIMRYEFTESHWFGIDWAENFS